MAQLVEHLTGDWRVASLSLTAGRVTVLFSLARHFMRGLVLAQPRKTFHDFEIIDWDIKNPNKQKY